MLSYLIFGRLHFSRQLMRHFERLLVSSLRITGCAVNRSQNRLGNSVKRVSGLFAHLCGCLSDCSRRNRSPVTHFTPVPCLGTNSIILRPLRHYPLKTRFCGGCCFQALVAAARSANRNACRFVQAQQPASLYARREKEVRVTKLSKRRFSDAGYSNSI
jgi:hypothetical protein